MALKDIFRSFFKKPEVVRSAFDDYDLQDDDAWRQTTGPAFTRGMPIELQDKDGAHLLYGKLLSYNLYEMTLERIPGNYMLPVIAEGTSVVIKGFNKSMDAVNMCGRIALSSAVTCRMRELEPIQYVDRRDAPRLPLLNTPAQLYRGNDLSFHDPWDCKVLDIGMGGACIVSEWCIPDDLELRLRVELVKKNGVLSFPCKVVRTIHMPDGKFEYGLLFAQLDRKKHNDLQRELDAARREIQRIVGS